VGAADNRVPREFQSTGSIQGASQPRVMLRLSGKDHLRRCCIDEMVVRVADAVKAKMSGTRLLIDVARLIRIEYCLLGALGVIVGGLLVAGPSASTALSVSAISVFLVAAGCYALDDYYDRDTDAANMRSDRPLLAGSPSLRTALIVGITSFVLAAGAALLAGPWTTLFVIAGAIAALAYNRWLQGIPLVKNVLLAGAFPAPILIGGLSGGSTGPLLWYAAGLAYVLGLGFEIMIDIGDAPGDLRTGVVTLSTTRGIEVAARVSSAFLVVGVAIAALPFFLPLDGRLQWDVSFALLIAAAGIAIATVVRRLLMAPSPAPILGLKFRTFAALHVFVLGYALGVLL